MLQSQLRLLYMLSQINNSWKFKSFLKLKGHFVTLFQCLMINKLIIDLICSNLMLYLEIFKYKLNQPFDPTRISYKILIELSEFEKIDQFLIKSKKSSISRLNLTSIF